MMLTHETPWQAYARLWRAIGGDIVAIPGTSIPDAPFIRVMERDDEGVTFVDGYGQVHHKPIN